jgi:hypothetical protein
MQIPGFSSPADPLADELAFYAQEFEQLRMIHGDRLARYRDYRAELELSRRKQAIRQSEIDDYGQERLAPNTPRRHAIALPFGQALTVKHAYRVAGRPPDAVVDRREENESERYRSNVMEKLVWAIYGASNGDVQLSDGAWDGSQVGSCVFDLYFDQARQLPVFREVDPATFLDVPGDEDPHHFTRVYRFWETPVVTLRADYAGKSFRGEPIPVADIGSYRKEGTTELALTVQMCDRRRALRFVMGKRPVPLYELQHDLGFTPYVVIPNLGPERNVWGWSDYEFVRDLVDYLPRLFSREADLIRMVSSGVYLEQGTGLSGARLTSIFRQGGFVPGKRDAQLTPIGTAEVPSFEPHHHDMGLAYFKMLGFSPDADWGESGATSGSDRSLQLTPSYQLSGLKQINWGSGLSRLYSYAFQMFERKQTGPAYVSGVQRSTSTRREERFGFRFPQPDPPPDSVDLEGPPQTAEELFAGNYQVRFVWQNKVDPDDPAYVASELNKFQQGAQSLETTLENLGNNAPEEEMRRIEAEADRFPWIRQGQIALLKAQMQQGAQGEGGGPPPAPADYGAAGDTMAQPDGRALDLDALTGTLNNGVGTPYGGA